MVWNILFGQFWSPVQAVLPHSFFFSPPHWWSTRKRKKVHCHGINTTQQNPKHQCVTTILIIYPKHSSGAATEKKSSLTQMMQCWISSVKRKPKNGHFTLVGYKSRDAHVIKDSQYHKQHWRICVVHEDAT